MFRSLKSGSTVKRYIVKGHQHNKNAAIIIVKVRVNFNSESVLLIEFANLIVLSMSDCCPELRGDCCCCF